MNTHLLIHRLWTAVFSIPGFDRSGSYDLKWAAEIWGAAPITLADFQLLRLNRFNALFGEIVRTFWIPIIIKYEKYENRQIFPVKIV